MSFTNHLAFNISKATPTTSTTNTHSTSTPPASNEGTNSGGTNNTNSKSPFLQNILSKSTPSAGNISPQLGSGSTVTPTFVNIGDEGAHGSSTKDNQAGNNKTDLIDLLGKYDISNKRESEEDDSQDDEEAKIVINHEEETKDDHNNEKTHEEANDKLSEATVKKVVEKEESSTPIELKDPQNDGSTSEMIEKQPDIKPAHEGTIQNIHDKNNTSTETNTNTDVESKAYRKTDNNTEMIADTNAETNAKTNAETNADRNIKSSTNSDLGLETEERTKNKVDTSIDTNIEAKSKTNIEAKSKTNIETNDRTNVNPDINVNTSLQHYEKDSEVHNDRDLTDITGNANDEESVAEEYTLNENVSTPIDSEQEDNFETEEAYKDVLDTQNRSGKSKKNQPLISSAEQYQQSHKPFDFQQFLNHLKKKSADPIVRYIRSFLVSFSRQGHTFTADQKIKIIRDFKEFMNEKFSLYEPFASMDDIDLENSREGLEKLIMNRLYEHCFPPEVAAQSPNFISESIQEDLQNDENFLKQLERFNWINGTHLDIDLDYLTKLKSKTNKENLNFIDFAITELNKINNYRAPRDKIICILNSCKIIFSFLRVSKRETNADSFIPLLILVIIKAKTDSLISNMHYIEHFRNEEWLSHGETSYYLSSLQGAIGFIQNLSSDDLTIDQAEYNAHMEAWEAEEKQRNSMKPIVMPVPKRKESGLEEFQNLTPSKAGLSPSNVLMTSAEMFTKSLSNFLSPSPQESPRPNDTRAANGDQWSSEQQPQTQSQPQDQAQSQENSAAMKETYKSLREVFPNLDKAVLKDVVFMNQGKLEESLDACLQLVNDV